MRPLILRNAVLAESVSWRDAATDTDPLPAIVAADASGITSSVPTRITEVRQETTDDK